MQQKEEPRTVEDIEAEADDIASTITKILVQAFAQKEGREPTAEEVQMLIEELTEERIESMLSGTGLDNAGEEGQSDGQETDDDEDVSNGEVVVDNSKTTTDPPEPICGAEISNKRAFDDKVADYVSENTDENGQSKKLKCSEVAHPAEGL